MTLNKSQIPESCLASVSGSTFVNADCFDIFPFIEDKSIEAKYKNIKQLITNTTAWLYYMLVAYHVKF